jgi:hypothetical protein
MHGRTRRARWAVGGRVASRSGTGPETAIFEVVVRKNVRFPRWNHLSAMGIMEALPAAVSGAFLLSCCRWLFSRRAAIHRVALESGGEKCAFREDSGGLSQSVYFF